MPAKKAADKKKKGGRKPFEFTPALLKKIKEMASHGLTQEQIAINIGLNPSTLSTKKSQIVKLSEAIKEGQASGIHQVTNALYNRAMEGDNTAMIFYLCNRDRDNWKHVSKAGEDKEKDDDKLTQVLAALIAKLPD